MILRSPGEIDCQTFSLTKTDSTDCMWLVIITYFCTS